MLLVPTLWSLVHLLYNHIFISLYECTIIIIVWGDSLHFINEVPTKSQRIRGKFIPKYYIWILNPDSCFERLKWLTYLYVLQKNFDVWTAQHGLYLFYLHIHCDSSLISGFPHLIIYYLFLFKLFCFNWTQNMVNRLCHDRKYIVESIPFKLKGVIIHSRTLWSHVWFSNVFDSANKQINNIPHVLSLTHLFKCR